MAGGAGSGRREEETHQSNGTAGEDFLPNMGSTDSLVPNGTSSEEPAENRYERPVSKIKFYLGCFLAFLSGFLTMMNNFLIKETGSDFGELLATRSLLQLLVMFTWIKVQGLTIFPSSHMDKFLLGMMGLSGGLTMVSAYSCVRFMPVADAMTLIFTNPLFTIIFEVIFVGAKLTWLKIVGGSCLMAGIVLVMKPPFLFPPPNEIIDNSTYSALSTAWHDYLDRDGQEIADHFNSGYGYSQALTDVSDGGDPSHLHPAHDLYFVGAVIALGCAIIAGGNSIIQAKLGHIKPVVQLLYVGFGALLVSCFTPLLDPEDRFFSGQIVLITWQQWLTYVGLACSGMCSYACIVLAIWLLVPPSTVAALRTLQIVLAFIAQVAIFGSIPAALDVSGAIIIVVCALAITFEKKITATLERSTASCWQKVVTQRMRRRSSEDGDEDRLV